jgi:Outer membrane protein beta-barrel domain
MLRRAGVVLVMSMLGALPRPAHAQTPVEISGGYSVAHDPRDDVTLPSGWMAGAAIGLTPALSVVGDVSGQDKTIALLSTDARLSVHTLMGGVRASARLGRVTEFGQILAGAVRTSGSAFGSTLTGTSVGVQPGVGLDYPLTGRLAARAEFDVRLIRHQSDATNGGHQFRFVAGVAYRLRIPK